MTRQSKWPEGIEIQKITLGFPRRMLEEARVRAMREGWTLQEYLTEALSLQLADRKKHLRRVAVTGRAPWSDLQEEAATRGQVFRGWRRGSSGWLEPNFEPKKRSDPQ